MKQLRQGDVYLCQVAAEIDTTGLDRIRPEQGRYVLARGEATGHIHALHASRARLFRDVIGLLLVVDRAVKLRHGDPAKAWQGDHGDVYVPPGQYRVTIDREYEPAGWREVLD